MCLAVTSVVPELHIKTMRLHNVFRIRKYNSSGACIEFKFTRSYFDHLRIKFKPKFVRNVNWVARTIFGFGWHDDARPHGPLSSAGIADIQLASRRKITIICIFYRKTYDTLLTRLVLIRVNTSRQNTTHQIRRTYFWSTLFVAMVYSGFNTSLTY